MTPSDIATQPSPVANPAKAPNPPPGDGPVVALGIPWLGF
jgi:hypothetical protein